MKPKTGKAQIKNTHRYFLPISALLLMIFTMANMSVTKILMPNNNEKDIVTPLNKNASF
jgi:ABC-type Fe3+-siderophore transport system permease subunit